MRSARTFVLAICLLGSALAADAATARIIKVLPHYLDLEGRHTLSPSLYERDAYQAHLRRSPKERSGLRFDVQWKSHTPKHLTLRLELRGEQGKTATTAVLAEAKTKRGLFSLWSSLTLGGEDYKKFGDLSAWRATIWEGDRLLAEQKSFLW